MIDLLLTLVEQAFGGTNLYILTILMMLAIGIIYLINKNWLQMPRYMLETVRCQIGIGVCLKRLWHGLYGLYD